MELAFLTPLLKDSTDSVSRGVAINNEGVLEAWLTKNQSRTNCINKGLKSGFVFVIPNEMASLCAMGDQCVEWCGKHTKIPDVHAVEI